MRKYVLDTNCYIDASRDADAHQALATFVSWAAPGLYVSSVVAAELRAGAGSVRDRRTIEDRLLGPFARHERVLTPSAAAWDALGRTLAALRDSDGLQLAQTSRGFAFDVLLAHTCREHGATLISANAKDMARIRRVFAFESIAPYPPARK
ncbi:MAG: PIN domain-containing protein [Gemmatimonadaceae bacterium]|nr:PIN domain-containing protein [Gemmatimonadaceae bacterium]